MYIKRKKGFTIPELLATVAIIGVLATIAVASYSNISKSIKERTYESKIKLIETKASEFASDNNITNATISVARLINDGYLDIENDVGSDLTNIKNERINDPRGGYLDCYNILISRNIDDYTVKVNPSTDCTLADNDNLNASVKIYAFASNSASVVNSNYRLPDNNTNVNALYKALGSNNDTTWTNASDVYLYVDLNAFKDKITNANVVKVTWNNNGVESASTNAITYSVTDDTNYANVYKVSTSVLLNTKITAKIVIDDLNIEQKIAVKIDREKPTLKYDLSSEYVKASAQKDLRLIGDDSNGSGIVAYSLQKDTNGTPSFSAADSSGAANIQISGNGKYYAYTKDAVGNISDVKVIEVNSFDEDIPFCKEPVDRNANEWAHDFTYTYGCSGDNTTGCKTEDKTETINYDTYKKTITWNIEDNVGNTFTCVKKDLQVNVDNTAPTCNIEVVGTKGKNNWYTSKKVTLVLKANDNFMNEGSIAATGLSTNASPDYNGVSQVDLTSDTDGVTYYGYVKDKAGNTGTCQVTVKILSEVPTCSVNVAGGRNGTDWYVSDVTATVSSNSRYIVDKKITNNNQETYVVNYNTTGVDIFGRVENAAGTANTCKTTIKRDADAPNVDFTFRRKGDTYECSSSDDGCNDVVSEIKLNYSVSGMKSAKVSNHSSTRYIGTEDDINACIKEITGKEPNSFKADDYYYDRQSRLYVAKKDYYQVRGYNPDIINFYGGASYVSKNDYYYDTARDKFYSKACYYYDSNSQSYRLNNGVNANSSACEVRARSARDVGTTPKGAPNSGYLPGTVAGIFPLYAIFNFGYYEDFETMIARNRCWLKTRSDKTKWEYIYYDSPHTYVQDGGSTDIYYAKVCSNANVCKEYLAEITVPALKKPENTSEDCSILGGAAAGAAAGYVGGCILSGFLGGIGMVIGVVGGAIAGAVACAAS